MGDCKKIGHSVKKHVAGLIVCLFASVLHADFNSTDQAKTVLGQNLFTTDFPDRADEHAMVKGDLSFFWGNVNIL